MSTITAILKPDSDGTLHLPVPAAWQKLPIRIVAEMEPATAAPQPAKPGLWKDLPDRFWMSADFDDPLEEFKDYME